MSKPDTTELYNRLPVSKPEDIQDVLDYWTELLQTENHSWSLRFRVFEGQGYTVDVWNESERVIIRELHKKPAYPLGIAITWGDLESIELGMVGLFTLDKKGKSI